MSEPIRSASPAPIAAARPLVHSRRVSLRVGPFGLTYSTDRILWNTDPPPVDPAPAVESEPQPGSRPEASTFPLDLEAARRRSLWAAAQDQAARQQVPEGQNTGQQRIGRQNVASETAGQEQARQTPGSGPVAESQARPDQAQAGQFSEANSGGADSSGARTGGSGVQAGQSRGSRALAQAMRQATQAYRACQAGFACPRPMLQAVA